MKSLVSVIIPAFNNADTIIETLQSIEKQTYTYIEVIIVDDGSKDNLSSCVEQYKTTTKLPIQYFYQENAGPSKARNYGVAKATGAFIVFVDADDYIQETYLEKAAQLLEQNPNLQIVYADAEFFGATSGKWELANYNVVSFLKYNCIPIFAMHRRAVFLEVGQFDTHLNFTEDWELWIRIIKKYGGVYKIPETMYYYRKRENQTSLSDNMNVNNNSDLSRLYIYNKHYDFYTENELNLTSLINSTYQLAHYKKKYHNIWYKKLVAKLKGKKHD